MKASRHGLLPPLAVPAGGLTIKKEVKESPREEAEDMQPGTTNTLSEKVVASAPLSTTQVVSPEQQKNIVILATTKDSMTTQEAIVSERIVNESNNNN